MDEMAGHYCKSRVIFNNAINNDLNMRVFEALCSGSLLVTDSAPGSGLTDFFTDKKHLIIYDDVSLEDTISYYLENDSERELIASKGRKEVLDHHTYDHRVDYLIQVLNSNIDSGDDNRPGSDFAKPSSYYENVRNDLIPLIPVDAKCILEIGCAAGMTGRELKKRNGAFVAGVELNSDAANMAKSVLDDVIQGNIEEIELPYSDESFDCILFADVLEHLIDPLSVLIKVRRLLKTGGSIVACLPNVQFHGLIHQLIEGNWTYAKEGILDETHLRFFTFKEIEKIFVKAGYSIQVVEEVLDPQFDKFSSANVSELNFGRTQIKDLSPEELKRFFVFQYKISAQPINTTNCKGDNMFQRGETLYRIDNLLLEASKAYDRDEHKMALQLYSSIMEMSPDNVKALVGQGNSYMKLQQPDQAESCFDRACTLDPDNYRAWLGSGLLALHKGENKKADICFHKALESGPDNDKAYRGLGILRMNRKDFDGAMDYFCQALDVNPENFSACKFLLEISYELGEFDKIEVYLKRFMEFHPANMNMRFALAGIQYKQGNLTDSIKNLEDILALEPEHKSALELIENVRSDAVLSK